MRKGLFGAEDNIIEPAADDKNKFVELAMEYMSEHYFENLQLSDIAVKLGITSGYLSTLFQRQTGKGFVDHLNEIRIEHACTYLQQNYLKIYEIAYKVGFNDEKYFYKVFKKIIGQPPSEFRKSNRM